MNGFRRVFLLLIFCQVFVCTASAQQDLFQTGYGGSGTEVFNAIIPLASGGFVAAGSTTSFGQGQSDIFLVRLDSNGDQLWSKTIGTPAYDNATCIIQHSDGGFVIAGSTLGFGIPGDEDAFIARTDSTGDLLWFVTVADSGIDCFNDIAWSVNGTILATGTGFPNMQQLFMATIVNMDTLGNIIWNRMVGATLGPTVGQAITRLPGSNFIVAGYRESTPNSDALITKISSAGIATWSKTIAGTGQDLLYDVCYSHGKKCAAVGTSASVGAGGHDLLFTLFDTNGVCITNRYLGTAGTEYGYSILPCADRGFIISGLTNGFNGQFEPFILKTDSLGRQQWLRILGTVYPDCFYATARTANGKFISCGYSEGLGPVGNQSGYVALCDSSGASDCNSFPFTFFQDSSSAFLNVPPTNQVGNLITTQRILTAFPVPAIETYALCLTDVNEGGLLDEITMYPNPADESVQLNNPYSYDVFVDVYNASGEYIAVHICPAWSSTSLNTCTWSSGSYLLVYTTEEAVHTSRLFVQH